ncbi:hypothetical protein PSTT_09747 [Puccinia striiformis]|uniref:Uncharacterized protein n=1 Tax=Puccinia striiformis TaxID=27350 RepID=A0A2S4V765_9BASI|nr:hypothetical protein PSTT_09747 [Puccinia striiformis]
MVCTLGTTGRRAESPLDRWQVKGAFIAIRMQLVRRVDSPLQPSTPARSMSSPRSLITYMLYRPGPPPPS